MSFLDKLSKGVGKAAEQAKFEADKLAKVNRLNSELGRLASELDTANAALGAKVMELKEAGQLAVPELDEMLGQIEVLQATVAAKKAEVEEVKASKFEEKVVAAPAAEAPGAAPAEAGAGKFCPNCGGGIEPGAKFCPSCGHKIG